MNFVDPSGLKVDLNLVDPKDPSFGAGEHINKPGYFTIMVHGKPGEFSSVGPNSKLKGQTWTVAQLAQLIYEKIKAGQDVILYSCEAAKGGGKSNIQVLANYLDIFMSNENGYSGQVWGPTTKLLRGLNKDWEGFQPGLLLGDGKLIVDPGSWQHRGQNRR